MRLLIGTNNPSKLALIRGFLDGIGAECVSPAMLGLEAIPAEEERTVLGNAIAKAKAWHAASGLPVLTEDSGLVFLDLPAEHPDQPGVLVRRACGHSMDDEEMLHWYQQIIRRHGGRMRAAWQDAWCVLTDAECFSTMADDHDKLVRHAWLMLDRPCEARLPGWPLDSLTYFERFGKYKAEMNEKEAQLASEGNCAEDRDRVIRWLRQCVTDMIKGRGV